MKKMIFAVLVVLLAMLAVTCDSAILPGGKLAAGPGVVAPPPGAEPEWVTVSINVGSTASRSRAVTGAAAKSAANFFEVVFVTGEVTVRSTMTGDGDGFADDWDVLVPKVVYTNGGTNKAVLFAGKKGVAASDPNILLGIGVLNATSGDLTTGSANPTVAFTVTSITTAVTTGTDSSFKLTSYADTVGYGPTGYTNNPMFEIPNSASDITASYTFTNANLANAVVATGGALIEVEAETGSTAGTITVGSILPAANSPVTGGKIDFTITTGTGTGLAKLTIAVPVHAISSTTTHGRGGSPVDWSLQALYMDKLDGTDTGNDGGAVLLNVKTFTPKVSINNTTAAAMYDWNSVDKILTYYINGTDANKDIVLDAAAVAFTSITALEWRVAANATTVNTTSDPSISSIIGATVSGATTTAAKLTIDTTTASSILTTAGGPFFVYCFGDDGTEYASEIITIMVQTPENIQTGIGGTGGTGGFTW